MSKSRIKSQVKLDLKQSMALSDRVDSNSELSGDDKKIIQSVLELNGWLQSQLESQKLSLSKLRSLFDIKTEKKSLL